MPDCNYKLVPPSSIPSKGGQTTLWLEPQLKLDCRLGPASASGDFKVAGYGNSAKGSFLTIESLEDNAKGTVTITVQCEDCGPTKISLELPAVTAAKTPPHAAPEDEAAKIRQETIGLKRAWLKEIDETIKKAEAAAEKHKKAIALGTDMPGTSQEASDWERVIRLKKEKIEMMEKLEKELRE